jgi:tRNA-2-methylthio-N6-dimethylallyladenosine synthase
MQLVRNCRYDGLYIFKYSKRSGTPAANLDHAVSEAEKTARFVALEELQISLQDKIYKNQIGRRLSVLVEKQSARSQDDVSGHSTCNKVVNFKGKTTQCGSIVDVLISEAKPNSLYGTAIRG